MPSSYFNATIHDIEVGGLDYKSKQLPPKLEKFVILGLRQ